MNTLHSSSRPRSLGRALVNPTQARQWGSNWGSKKKPNIPPKQQTPKQPQTVSLQSACSTLADSVTTTFLRQGLRGLAGMCVPASVVFKEAVEELDTGADVQLELCYLRRRLRTGYDKCMRHMVARVDGQLYNIGTLIANTSLAAQGHETGMTQVLDHPPEGVQVFGWSARFVDDPEHSEVDLMDLLGSPSGRECWFSMADPELLQAREKVLAFARSLKGTVQR